MSQYMQVCHSSNFFLFTEIILRDAKQHIFFEKIICITHKIMFISQGLIRLLHKRIYGHDFCWKRSWYSAERFAEKKRNSFDQKKIIIDHFLE